MSDLDRHDHGSHDHGFHDHESTGHDQFSGPNGAGSGDSPEPALPGLEYDPARRSGRELIAAPPQPVNWTLLSADDAQTEWLELNRWVHWLRRTYGLPSSVIPPLWHRHWELVWELSALHLHWLTSYDPDASGTAPLNWHREFAEARLRLRDWVAACGTRSEFDRPTPQATWPGEADEDPPGPVEITNRDGDFVRFVTEDVSHRREAEDAFYTKVAELADRDVRHDVRS